MPPSSGRRPLVDYGQVAARYDAGRSLGEESLARWRAVTLARVRNGPPGRVLDLGAGTGIFAAAWLRWGAERVVAVEPSSAMRAQAMRRSGGGLWLVAGTAERLPVAPASIDVAWLSAVIHHLPDLDVVASQVHDVLRPAGRMFVRGFFPDRSVVPWLDRLPGAGRARARFPTTGHTATVLERSGLRLVDIVDVAEPRRSTCGEAADWILAMRTADTLLTALGDDEIAAGVEALRRTPSRPLPAGSLTLLTLERPGGG